MKRLAILAVLGLASCGGGSKVLAPPAIAPPTVQAVSITPGCDSAGVCSGKIVKSWGYCLYSSYQTSRTYAVFLEIGVSSTPTDPNDSLCVVPLAFGGNLVTLDGNSSYNSQAPGESGMLEDLRACTDAACSYPSGQEHLTGIKTQAKGNSIVNTPLKAEFPTAIHATGFMVVFNDDLAKPTNHSIAISGELQ